MEDRIGAGEKAQRLRLLGHVLAPGREPHHRQWHGDAGGRDRARELDRIEPGAAGERRTLHLHQHVDRYAFGMDGKIRQRRDQADAILARLAHADDAATANRDAGIAHVLQRVEPVLINAGRDDAAVVLGRGIEVVIVIVEAGVFQPFGLLGLEHAERHAGLHPECAHALDHLTNAIKIAILWRAPSRAHAKASRAGGLRGAGFGQHGLDAHQLGGFDAGVIARALRTIGAVFGTTAGLYREQL